MVLVELLVKNKKKWSSYKNYNQQNANKLSLPKNMGRFYLFVDCVHLDLIFYYFYFKSYSQIDINTSVFIINKIMSWFQI